MTAYEKARDERNRLVDQARRLGHVDLANEDRILAKQLNVEHSLMKVLQARGATPVTTEN